MSQDECRVSMVQRKSACIVFDPRTTRIEAPFSIFCQFLIYPMAKCHLSGIIFWDPSS